MATAMTKSSYRGPKQALDAADRALIAKKDRQAREAAEKVDARPLTEAELSRHGVRTTVVCPPART